MTSATPATPTEPAQPRQILNIQGFARNLLRRQLWLVIFIILDLLIANAILNDPILREAWSFIFPGIAVTVRVTIISFIVAIFIGLITAFGRVSKNTILYNLSTLYVELFRGLPLLVIVLIFAFVITPGLVDLVVGPGDAPRIPFMDDFLQRLMGIDPERIPTTVVRTRDIDPVFRITFAFSITYGAFMSEVFRAGIESIGTGQMEAGRSLGMNYVQVMRYIILPQAIRNVLPALVNNFVFLLKDTSLASVVAVPEISHLTRQYSSNQFRYPEGLLVLAFLYANLTIFLSLGAAWLENRLTQDRRGAR